MLLKGGVGSDRRDGLWADFAEIQGIYREILLILYWLAKMRTK